MTKGKDSIVRRYPSTTIWLFLIFLMVFIDLIHSVVNH